MRTDKWLNAEALGQFGGPEAASGRTLAEHRTVRWPLFGARKAHGK